MDPHGERARAAYVFDRAWDRERERLEAQARLVDASTIRHLEDLGLQDGWRCAEIGAGAGSMALWMASRVAPAGRTVATDLDTRFLEDLRHPALEVRVHDILAGPLEEDAYDLVHTRLLLRHLPGHEQALRNMVGSLKPGGWLLAEDFDLCTAGVFHPPSPLQARLNDALQELLAKSGVQPRYGIQLPGLLRAAGLRDVDADAHLRVIPLGSADAEALALKLEHFRAGLVRGGLATEDQVDRAIAEARDSSGGAVHYPPLMVSAWGRRPS
jgi:SAM-dependent methyltransferase